MLKDKSYFNVERISKLIEGSKVRDLQELNETIVQEMNRVDNEGNAISEKYKAKTTRKDNLKVFCKLKKCGFQVFYLKKLDSYEKVKVKAEELNHCVEAHEKLKRK